MNRPEELLTALIDENYIKTKEIVHEELYTKMGNAIDSLREDVYALVFDEAKKAKKTDKEDDGEGMDPVGAGDSDIDNDGDSDESDEYLSNRRKAIGKSIKKKKNGDDEDDDDDVNEAQYEAGTATGRGTNNRDLKAKSRVGQTAHARRGAGK
jgi:hypothetical protein